MNGIEDDLMTELTDLTLKDISTLEKGMQSLVREEVRRYKLETGRVYSNSFLILLCRAEESNERRSSDEDNSSSSG